MTGTPTSRAGDSVGRKTGFLAGIVIPILALDIITKRWALAALDPGRTIEPLGSWLPITLAFNRGAAFGIRFTEDPRLVFVPITIVALVVLSVLLKQATQRDYVRIVSISLVMAGALGNLIDRVRWNRGVVDFIGPYDLGFMDWPIFNVADMAISCGAVLLALSFGMEERQLARAAEEQESRGETGGGEGPETVNPPSTG
jgi:signal peptidase II